MGSWPPTEKAPLNLIHFKQQFGQFLRKRLKPVFCRWRSGILGVRNPHSAVADEKVSEVLFKITLTKLSWSCCEGHHKIGLWQWVGLMLILRNPVSLTIPTPAHLERLCGPPWNPTISPPVSQRGAGGLIVGFPAATPNLRMVFFYFGEGIVPETGFQAPKLS